MRSRREFLKTCCACGTAGAALRLTRGQTPAMPMNLASLEELPQWWAAQNPPLANPIPLRDRLV